MTPARWQQLDQLLDTVLELPAAEREAFLADHGNGDEDLRREVAQMLASEVEADDFFAAGPVAAMAEVFRWETITGLGGQKIGPYQILNEIGRGGMGVVYRAVRADDEYRQEVAIKLVWPGPQNTELLRRFRRERQILANLDHPHIARLLDGGSTEQGWPYLVMEYIEGVPITQFCQQQKTQLRERLALFRDVCSAVQYAHQNLVIHRDLKPGNILVTETGKAKLLDFGIAKLLDTQRHQITAHPTRTGTQLMTPEYASPEQVRGEQITTASDVYSLGVLLYELLTGQSPYRFKSHALPEIIRTVCEDEPLPPSAECAELKGDLDVIVLTALSKDIARRYSSVEQLSEDLRRFLEDKPIFARKPTLRYRAAKFVRRNRLGVVAATGLVLVLLAGTLATVRQARIAIRESARAEQQAQEANRQRKAAEGQAAEARKQELLAENNAADANQQRALAEAQTAEANKQQQLAEDERSRAQAGETALRRLAYTSQMNLGARQWELANISGLREAVNNQFPKPGETDLRGFEWYYLWRLLNHNGERLNLLHREGVWAVAYAPDGKTIATGHSEDESSVKLWDAATGNLIRTFAGDHSVPFSVTFSPDGKMLAVGFQGPMAMVWEVASGRRLAVLKGHKERVSGVKFSPDGRTLATGSDDETVKLWDAISFRELLTLQAKIGLVKSVAFSPDGKLLAASGVGSRTVTVNDPKIKLWNLVTGQEMMAFGPTGGWTLAFAPDGKKLAAGSSDGLVRLWEVNNPREIVVFKGHTSRIRSIAFAPNGIYLASAAEDRTARLWGVETGQELTTLKAHRAEVFAVAFSPDSRSLVTGATDNMAKVWNVAAVNEVSVIVPGISTSNLVAFSPDGSRLATVAKGSSSVIIRSAQTGGELVRCQGHSANIDALAFSPDGKMLATATDDNKDKTVKLWDANTGKELATFNGDPEMVTGIFAVVFSPDSRKLAHTDQQGTVRVWDVVTRRTILKLTGHSNHIWSLAFSPDGSKIAAGSLNNVVKVWDAVTGKEFATFSGQSRGIRSVAFSPNGQILAAGSADSTVKLWQLATGRELTTLTGSAGQIKSIAFSPDGNRLVTGSGDALVRLWDLADGRELIVLKGHSDQINSVAFAPDGQTIASASMDGTIRLWRAATRQEVATVSKK